MLVNMTAMADGNITPSENGPYLVSGAVRLTDVNAICSALKKKGQLVGLNWEDRARVPKDHYKLQRP